MKPEKPLAELTLRKYEKPFRLSGRQLVKKLCLSIGLLQPGDSRDVIVDVLHVLLANQKPLSRENIENSIVTQRKELDLPLVGITSSNVRRQIRRLKDLFLVERIGNEYKLSEEGSLSDIFSEKIEKFYLPSIVSRVKEYCEAIEKERGG